MVSSSHARMYGALRRLGLFGLFGLFGAVGSVHSGCGDSDGSGGLFSADLSGALTIESPGAEPLVFTPDVCLSGQRQVFNGVSLYSEDDDIVVDVVDDPLAGLAVALTLPSACQGRGACPPIVVSAVECPELRGEVFTNTRVTTNNIWHVEGWVSLRCDLPDDGLLFGDLNFEGCH